MSKLSYSELLPVLEKLEENGYGNVYDGYSGRGMYGARCLGFDTDDPDAVNEAVIKAGGRMGTQDRLGMGYIVYWPGVRDD